MTEDCFDLVNQFNQSIDKLQRIGKQAFDSSQQMQALHKEFQKEFSPAAAQQLQTTLSTLDNLNERTNGFMARMDVLKSGLSAIENQLVSIDRATHQWVENGHGNQRQGWEVLGAMEGIPEVTQVRNGDMLRLAPGPATRLARLALLQEANRHRVRAYSKLQRHFSKGDKSGHQMRVTERGREHVLANRVLTED